MVAEHAHRAPAAETPLFPSVQGAAPFAATSCAECVLRLTFQMLAACMHRHAAFHRWLIDWYGFRSSVVAGSLPAMLQAMLCTL